MYRCLLCRCHVSVPCFGFLVCRSLSADCWFIECLYNVVCCCLLFVARWLDLLCVVCCLFRAVVFVGLCCLFLVVLTCWFMVAVCLLVRVFVYSYVFGFSCLHVCSIVL